MSNHTSPGEDRVLHQIVSRVMRQGGFHGTVDLVSARLVKGGYSVLVKATLADRSERYRAFVPKPGSRNKAVKVHKVERKVKS